MNWYSNMIVPDPAIRHEVSARSLKVETLSALRLIGAVGQTFAVAVMAIGVTDPVPVDRCLGLVLLSVLLTLVLKFILPPNHRLDGQQATILLAFDICQFSAFIYYTGGLDNPFSILLLVPVLVAAATLSPKATLALGCLVAVLATCLGFLHCPLPWGGDQRPVLPPFYLVGVWIALLTTLAVSAVYAFRVSEEARQLAEALAAAEMALAREQHLTALDGLAAAAAHELGTPLGTIAVIVRELEREADPNSPLAGDLALLKSQSDRCREILRKLSHIGQDTEWQSSSLPLTQLIEEVVDPYRGFSRTIAVRAWGDGPEPIGIRNPAILQGLANILENALDFAVNEVEVVGRWDHSTVSLSIGDDGPGFPAAILDRIGEPFVASRGERAGLKGTKDVAGGLGLGLFIAKTLLRRSGATFACGNRRFPWNGAIISITWPRKQMDIESVAKMQ